MSEWNNPATVADYVRVRAGGVELRVELLQPMQSTDNARTLARALLAAANEADAAALANRKWAR